MTGNSVALITGAGRGIGRAVAVELAAAGHRLGLMARTRRELEETASLAGGGLVLEGDVTRPEQIERSIVKLTETYNRLDAIIHCAGLAPVRSIEQMSVQEWRAVIDTNLSAAFYLCRVAWPIFRKQGGGVVVNVSSEAARDPFDGFAAYGAAKAALNLFGMSAAREGEAIGVRVHTIAPGAVETGMLRAIVDERQVPAHQVLSPRDVAKLIVRCVTGELCYTSGEVIYLHKVLHL